MTYTNHSTPTLGTYRRLCGAFLICLTALGCANHDRSGLTPSPERYAEYAPVGAPANARAFGDVSEIDSNSVSRELRKALSQHPRQSGFQILALSGGGADGAYGAGVLNGWSQTGERPEFDIVTGISTGAIIAPFAFLGSEYDPAIRRFYTSTDTRKISRGRMLAAMVSGGSLARSTPLQHSIERELTDDILRAIAAEHKKGRRLFVGTTNFDAERPVIWDLGQIASQGTPQAYDLVRKVVLASASIPVYFNPVRIPVTDGVQIREELHVDGALTQQIFTYPVDLHMREILSNLGMSRRKNTIWVIHNKRLEPKFQAQSTRLMGMTERTLSTLIRTQGLGDIAFIVSLAKRDGFEVNGIAVPPEFSAKSKEIFDPTYMNRLFAVGMRDGASGTAWSRDVYSEFYER